jgi:hypothetical protein
MEKITQQYAASRSVEMKSSKEMLSITCNGRFIASFAIVDVLCLIRDSNTMWDCKCPMYFMTKPTTKKRT